MPPNGIPFDFAIFCNSVSDILSDARDGVLCRCGILPDTFFAVRGLAGDFDRLGGILFFVI